MYLQFECPYCGMKKYDCHCHSVRNLLHQYQSDKRMAKVYQTPSGFEVDLYEIEKHVIDDEQGTYSVENVFTATRKLHNHSEVYAENCAENRVDEIIKEA